MAPKANISADLLKKVLSAGSGPVLVLLIILTQYIFKLDFTCPCSSSTESTVVTAMYLVLPCCTIFFVAILTDRQFKKAVGYCCSAGSCCCPWRQIFKGLTVASMWVITALLDGDWLICMMTRNGNYTHISCKEICTEEQTVVFNELKSRSQIFGFGCLCGLSFFWLLYFCLCSICTPFYKQKYHKCLEKTTHLHVKEQLQDMAKDKAHSICEKPLGRIRQMVQLPHQQNQKQDQLQQQLFLQIQLLMQQQHQWLEGQQQGQHAAPAPRGQEANANNPHADTNSPPANANSPSAPASRGQEAPPEGSPETPDPWIQISDPTFYNPTSSSKNGLTTTTNNGKKQTRSENAVSKKNRDYGSTGSTKPEKLAPEHELDEMGSTKVLIDKNVTEACIHGGGDISSGGGSTEA